MVKSYCNLRWRIQQHKAEKDLTGNDLRRSTRNWPAHDGELHPPNQLNTPELDLHTISLSVYYLHRRSQLGPKRGVQLQTAFGRSGGIRTCIQDLSGRQCPQRGQIHQSLAFLLGACHRGAPRKDARTTNSHSVPKLHLNGHSEGLARRKLQNRHGGKPQFRCR